ncbi:MAG: phosphotransferase [Chloroflexota bacterium]|nr:phosphotransferase [Chloroflexota bacterium]
MGVGQSGHQWRVGQADVVSVAAAFGLILASPDLEPLGGATNGVVRIATDAGDLVVRVHAPWTTPDRLAAVHAVQAHLRRHGLPVPAAMTARDGRSWATVDGRLAEVLPFVAGGHQAEDWADAGTAVAALGRLHVAPRTFAGDVPPPAQGCYLDSTQALDLLAATDAPFRSRATEPGFSDAARVRSDVEALLGHLVTARAAYHDAVPRHLVHGDLFGSNLLLSGDRVVAILDFDRLAVRPWVYEVAYELFHLLNRFRIFGLSPRDGDGGLLNSDLLRVAELLRRYAEAGAPLTPVELGALPYEMALAPLYPVAAAGTNAGRAVADTLGVAGQVPLARWMAASAERVTETLSDAPR